MAARAGWGGSITIGTSSNLCLRSWEIRDNLGIADVSCLGSQYRNIIATQFSASGSASGVMSGTYTRPLSSVSGTFIESSGGTTYACNVVVTRVSRGTSVDGAATVDLEFEVDGSISNW